MERTTTTASISATYEGLATIYDLPPELLYQIFKYFDGTTYKDIDMTIFTAMKVCRTWEATGYRVLFEVNVNSEAMMRGFWVYLEIHLKRLEDNCNKEQRQAKQERESIGNYGSARIPSHRRMGQSRAQAQPAPISQTGPSVFGMVVSHAHLHSQPLVSPQEASSKKIEPRDVACSKKAQIAEIKQIMSFCGSWNDEPRALKGDLQDVIWTELVLNRIRAEAEKIA